MERGWGGGWGGVGEDRSGVGIVKWPVAQVVGKQALHIKLSLY